MPDQDNPTPSVRLPVSLAFVLEAAGAVALERCGAILEERVFAGASDSGS